MRCNLCAEHFFAETQSAACPHPLLYQPAYPQGGPRLPQDVKVEIDDAFRMQDQMALYRLMGHGCVAARAYAKQMAEALDAYIAILPQLETRSELA